MTFNLPASVWDMAIPSSDASSTPFTELVGCRVPIQLATMGGVSTPELAAAVARSGGLGMLSGTGIPLSEIAAYVGSATGLAGLNSVVGLGFLMPFFDMASFEVGAAKVSVVECFYGDPDLAIVASAHEAGALIAWQVGSLTEAQDAAEAGCDFLVVQGVEAGGHIRGNEPLLPLLETVRARVRVPLVGAGGIGTGAAAVRAFEAGADGVRVGTRFLASAEADVHPQYLAALISATAEDTVVSETFSAGWPNAPHRTLTSALDASDADPSTRSPLPPTRSTEGEVSAMALYAGESVNNVVAPVTAESVVAEFSTAITEYLNNR